MIKINSKAIIVSKVTVIQLVGEATPGIGCGAGV